MEKSGGRPKKETTGFEKTKTTGFGNKKPNVNVNENVNVNVNENDNNNQVGDSCVDGLQEVINFYNNNIGALTPFGLTILEDYVKELNKDIVIYAMEISVEANKRTIQYIKAILNNWQKAGIKTLAEAKEESNKNKSSRRNNETDEEKQARRTRELKEALKKVGGS